MCCTLVRQAYLRQLRLQCRRTGRYGRQDVDCVCHACRMTRCCWKPKICVQGQFARLNFEKLMLRQQRRQRRRELPAKLLRSLPRPAAEAATAVPPARHRSGLQLGFPSGFRFAARCKKSYEGAQLQWSRDTCPFVGQAHRIPRGVESHCLLSTSRKGMTGNRRSQAMHAQRHPQKHASRETTSFYARRRLHSDTSKLSYMRMRDLQQSTTARI